jgi:Flp pilus assembly protein protease CpaA
MRTLHNWLLVIIGLLLFAMVLWVQERDAGLGYALGVALVGLAFFIVVERVNPRR